MAGAELPAARAVSTTERPRVHREPNSAERICKDRLVSLYAFGTKQTIFEPVFAHIRTTECADNQFVASHGQHMI